MVGVNNPAPPPTDSDRKTTGKVRFARHSGTTARRCLREDPKELVGYGIMMCA